MITTEDVQAQIARLPFVPTMKLAQNMDYLSAVMNQGERLLALSIGRFGKNEGLVALTDKRLLLIDGMGAEKMPAYWRGIALAEIGQIIDSYWYGTGNLQLSLAGEILVIYQMPTATAAVFVEHVRAQKQSLPE